jgi:hypothetical protein
VLHRTRDDVPKFVWRDDGSPGVDGAAGSSIDVPGGAR